MLTHSAATTPNTVSTFISCYTALTRPADTPTSAAFSWSKRISCTEEQQVLHQQCVDVHLCSLQPRKESIKVAPWNPVHWQPLLRTPVSQHPMSNDKKMRGLEKTFIEIRTNKISSQLSESRTSRNQWNTVFLLGSFCVELVQTALVRRSRFSMKTDG